MVISEDCNREGVSRAGDKLLDSLQTMFREINRNKFVLKTRKKVKCILTWEEALV